MSIFILFCEANVSSYYQASATKSGPYPQLQGSHQADICIVGAGFTGLSSALHLSELGYKVIVLEAETVGHGASGRNGGHVGTSAGISNIWRIGLVMILPVLSGP